MTRNVFVTIGVPFPETPQRSDKVPEKQDAEILVPFGEQCFGNLLNQCQDRRRNKALEKLEKEILAFIEKQCSGNWLNQCRGSDVFHKTYHETTFAITECPNMANFLTILKADIERTFKIPVTIDWSDDGESRR